MQNVKGINENSALKINVDNVKNQEKRQKKQDFFHKNKQKSNKINKDLMEKTGTKKEEKGAKKVSSKEFVNFKKTKSVDKKEERNNLKNKNYRDQKENKNKFSTLKSNQHTKKVDSKGKLQNKSKINTKKGNKVDTKELNNKPIGDFKTQKINVYKAPQEEPIKKAKTPRKTSQKVSPAKEKAVKADSATKKAKKVDTAEKKPRKTTKKSENYSKNLKVTFLGGVNEIGKNMTVLEYGKDMILIDAGQTFPDETLPGVDQVVQDITYLDENKDRIRGIFITHGHEDHIGAIPYVLKHFKAPIYGSRVSLGLIENKLREARLSGITLKSVKSGSVVVAGSFRVQFVSVTHSIPGSFALAITTPAGVVVHTGDFKVDFTPVGNDVCDLKTLTEIGNKGVTLFMSDSTNVEREGFSMSESVVGKTFHELLGKFKTERIIIATFASNIHRMQQIIDCAKKYGRKIAFTGRSMVNVSDMAIKLGELQCDKDIIVDIDKIDNYEDKELIILSTGSQGEAMSALTRIVSDSFPKIRLDDNDVVILSSSPIPGNEKPINNLINNLYRKGCKVIYNELADVHASGHAYKEELKIMHSAIRPKFFIPVHGEYRHLKNHQLLAQEMGMSPRNIIIPELGMQVEVNQDMMKTTGFVQAGDVLIDGTGFGDKDSNVIRDRLLLSQDGICVVVVTISSKSGQIVCEPDIFSRGFIYQDEASDIVSDAKSYIYGTLRNMDLKGLDQQEIRNNIRRISSNYFYKNTKRKPMILSIVKFD